MQDKSCLPRACSVAAFNGDSSQFSTHQMAYLCIWLRFDMSMYIVYDCFAMPCQNLCAILQAPQNLVVQCHRMLQSFLQGIARQQTLCDLWPV